MERPLRWRAIERGFWWAVFLGYAALIFRLSNGPAPEAVPLLSAPGGDVLYHIAEYGVFGLLAFRALIPRSRKGVMGVLLLGAVYAASDEFHQLFVSSREASVLDWGVDLAGLGSAWALARWLGWLRHTV